MHNEIKARLGKCPQFCHVPLDRSDIQPFALGHLSILLQLPGRIVKHGHLCSGGRQNGTLLASPRSQAKHIEARQLGKPCAGYRFGGGQQDLPAAFSRRIDGRAADRNGPSVPLFNLRVPGLTIVLSCIHPDRPGDSSVLEIGVASVEWLRGCSFGRFKEGGWFQSIAPTENRYSSRGRTTSFHARTK